MKKEANVVVLPTNRITDVILHTGEITNMYYYLDKEMKSKFGMNNHSILSKSESFQHIYIVSDEDIKEGDNVLIDDRSYIKEIPRYHIEQVLSIENNWIYCSLYGKNVGRNPDWTKKIIASTDPSLGLPRPSNEFVKKFVKLNGKINKILVKYDEGKPTFISKLRVVSDDTISIYPFKN